MYENTVFTTFYNCRLHDYVKLLLWWRSGLKWSNRAGHSGVGAEAAIIWSLSHKSTCQTRQQVKTTALLS